MNPPLLYFSGLQGETGAYAVPPGTPSESIARLGGEAPASEETEALKEWKARGARGLLRGDPRDLAQAGWGVVFLDSEDKKVEEAREALKPLLELRQRQAPGHRYREYRGRGGYRAGESKQKFLGRHKVAPGLANPEAMPYYLLLVGGPGDLPYEFQSLLDVERAVGRICFETAEEYETYARRVVASEEAAERRARRAAFFAPRHPGDRVADLCVDNLAVPLAREMRARCPGWQVEEILGEDASKERLAGLMGGPETPDLLFTAGHGLVFRSGDCRQVKHQGALMCREWPGSSWEGRIPADFYFSADDLGADGAAAAPITFFFACCSAGVPAWKINTGLRERIAAAPQPLVAQLPLRLLSQPKSGALAVIGHVDVAWIYSFDWPVENAEPIEDIEGFADVVEKILQGTPVGAAMEIFGRRHGELAADLGRELEEVEHGKVPDDDTSFQLWMYRDARNYVVLGDPAVRLAPLGPSSPEPRP